jgi:hypothetical protein
MTEIASRIMSIAKDNTMTAIVLTGIAPAKMLQALENLEKLRVTRPMVNCFWSHECKRDRDAFDAYVVALAARPDGCAHGCIWEPVKTDESAIFGPTEKPSHRDCAMAECETPSQYFCSYCYCVRYCSPLCQRLDRDRHKTECRKVVDALKILQPRGEVYAKRTIKNNISIDDAAWTRLWVKYAS